MALFYCLRGLSIASARQKAEGITHIGLDAMLSARKSRSDPEMRKFAAMSACILSVPAAASPLPRPAAFSTCATCHVTTQGQKSTIGPNLFGVSDRSSGELAGFAYSSAMKSVGLKWTRDNLAAFITAPQVIVPGTKMAFGGLKDPAKVDELLDYLGSLKQ